MTLKTKRWLNGILSATIQGGATAFISAGGVSTASMLGQYGVAVDPLTLNQTMMIFLGGAAKDFFMYLKNNPLPFFINDTVQIEKTDITP